MPFIGVRLGIPSTAGGGDTTLVARILLSDSTISEAASVGDLVGTFSVINGSGSYTYSLTDDAGGLFAVDGVDTSLLEVADTLADGTDTITVEADNGVDPPISRTFTITITAYVPPTENLPTFYWLGF